MALLSFGYVGNSIQDDGARALADALKSNTTVHTINLDSKFCLCVLFLLFLFCLVLRALFLFLFEFLLHVVMFVILIVFSY